MVLPNIKTATQFEEIVKPNFYTILNLQTQNRLLHCKKHEIYYSG